jgi:hypothetical protein
MFVPSAMNARFAASVMNVPALAARLPDGATQTIVGILASSSDDVIRLVASRAPPGVFSSTTTAAAPSSAAFATPPAMYSAMMLSTIPVVGIR